VEGLIYMRIFVLFILLAAGGCSKYEFENPADVKATVIYDKTGTAQQVASQLAAEGRK